MQLTHFGHSCLLAEFRDGNGDEVTVLFDPGTLAHGFEGITGLSAILLTHQHPDHVDRARLPALVEANPQAALYADPMTTSQLGGSWRAVNAGDAFSVGHLSLRGMGGTHAVVHPDIPLVDNIAYLVGDRGHPARLMHPGDALYVPDEPVEVLAAPATAPWLKISEAIDYLRAVAPTHAVPIHQGAVAKEARSYYYDRLSEMTDTDLRILPEENGMQF